MFSSVFGKLGNMRKPVEWTVMPGEWSENVIIQSANRIAKIHKASGKAWLSNGKGGHQGFIKLMPYLGAVEVEVPEEFMAQIVGLGVGVAGPVRIA